MKLASWAGEPPKVAGAGGRVAEPETTNGRQPVSDDNHRLRAEPAAYGLPTPSPHLRAPEERLSTPQTIYINVD